MSNPENAAVEGFVRVWAESTARVLESLAGKPFAIELATRQADESPAEAAASVWVRFAASGKLQAAQAFVLAKPDGVRMAQLLMSEPLDGASELAEGHADAIGEIFRQFAGFAATACKTKYGGEVQFELQDMQAPDWKAQSAHRVKFSAADTPAIEWTLMAPKELAAALQQALAPPPAAQATPAKTTVVEPAAAPDRGSVDGTKSANLDLLLDVELEASLRFGEREMLLRDILELRPGSVVELNRKLNEPAELLVAGRVIARGEVVVVDGNYGLRISDIAQPGQRIASIPT